MQKCKSGGSRLGPRVAGPELNDSGRDRKVGRIVVLTIYLRAGRMSGNLDSPFVLSEYPHISSSRTPPHDYIPKIRRG